MIVWYAAADDDDATGSRSGKKPLTAAGCMVVVWSGFVEEVGHDDVDAGLENILYAF